MRKTFLMPGPQVIRLKAVDNDGDFDVHQVTINVINRAPAPSISALPNAPLSLEPVTFTAGGTDPDGAIVSAVWDLDGDNSFESAGSGMTATRSFPKKGSYTVRVARDRQPGPDRHGEHGGGLWRTACRWPPSPTCRVRRTRVSR